MKCVFYITVRPQVDGTGKIRGWRGYTLNQSLPEKFPSDSPLGTFVLEVELDVPDEQTKVPKACIKLEAPNVEVAVKALERTLDELS